MTDDKDADSVESLDNMRSICPPGKGRKLGDEIYKPGLWNRRVVISDLSPPGKRRKLLDEHSKPDMEQEISKSDQSGEHRAV